jgi:hypothetical protein
MKEFGPHGKLKDIRSEKRRALFTDLVRIVKVNLGAFTVAATLTTEEYRRILGGASSMSMYGSCFLNMAMLNGSGAPIAYLLDAGSPCKHDVMEVYSYLIGHQEKYPLNMGTLAFDCDDRVSALQAADMVSWSVRRKLSSELKSGFEPLAELFTIEHEELPYKQKWMVEVASSLAKMKP